MDLLKKTIIVIPAYNEAKNIIKVIKGVRANLKDAQILIIDDFSSDETSRLVEKKNNITTLRHPFNMGYASSCQTGFKYAYENGYEIVIQMDADGQHEPESIKNLIKPIIKNEADLCIGSRFLNNKIYRASIPRKIGMFLLGRIATFFTKTKITDPTSGFQALNRKVLRVYCTDIYPAKYPDADLIIKMHFAGFRIIEIPVKMYPNPGKSMHNFFSSTFYIIEMAVSIFISLFSKTYVLKTIMEDNNEHKT